MLTKDHRRDVAIEWEPSVSPRQAHTGLAGAADPRSLSPDQWGRVVPIRLERAREHMDWDDDDAGGRTLVRLVLDHKLVPRAPVLDPGGSPEFVVSEAFVATLDALRVPGWHAQPVEHVSSNRPHVPPVYRLAVEGPPFVVTRGLDSSNTPRGPVSLRAEKANPAIGWTSWLGPSRSWRGLVVKADVVRALCERLGPDDPVPHVMPVEVVGSFATECLPVATWQHALAPDPAPPVEATWSVLREALSESRPPPSDETQRELALKLGLRSSSPLRRLMQWCDGAVLFGGALVLFPQTPGTLSGLGFEARSIGEENSASLLASSGLALPESTCLFARSHEGDVFWGVRGERIYGFGRGALPFGGHHYGSGQSLEAWLADWVGDLR